MQAVLFAVVAGLCWGVGEVFTKSVLHSKQVGPLAAIAVVKGVSWLEATDRWHWGKIVFGTIVLWLGCWAYKWAIYPG